MRTAMQLTIQPATLEDGETVSDILLEAATWLTRRGVPMWRESEVVASRIREDVAAGLFFLATSAGEPVGTLKFQLSDPLFWPDAPGDDAAYVHRLAVRRCFAGGAFFRFARLGGRARDGVRSPFPAPGLRGIAPEAARGLRAVWLPAPQRPAGWFLFRGTLRVSHLANNRLPTSAPTNGRWRRGFLGPSRLTLPAWVAELERGQAVLRLLP